MSEKSTRMVMSDSACNISPQEVDKLVEDPIKTSILKSVTLKSRFDSNTVKPMKETGIYKSQEEIFEEFERVKAFGMEKKTREITTAALEPANENKNRYNDILPFESSRVKLRYKGVNGSDYINANFIKFPGSNNPEYISCQAPIPATFYDFWWMVWEQRSAVIVMLTNFVEKDKLKAHRYWPLKGERLHFGNLSVCLNKTKSFDGTMVRSFFLNHMNTDGSITQREVFHLHFTDWPDMGVPPATDRIRNLVKLANISNKFAIARDSNGPMIVHCSAGIGRAGTFIAIDYGLIRLRRCLLSFYSASADSLTPALSSSTGSIKNLPPPVNVEEIVNTLRCQRVGMVQTIEQYNFVYQTLRDYVEDLLCKTKSSLLRKRNFRS